MLTLCYLVIPVITVLSYIQFIHVMMLLPVYMLKVTGLTKLMFDLVWFCLFSSVPPSPVHREEMLPLSSVFFPSSKIVDVLLWTLSSTAMAGSCFIGECYCYSFMLLLYLEVFESRKNFYVLLLSMIETIVVKA